MSTRNPNPPADDLPPADTDEVDDAPPPEPDSLRGMFLNPGVRNYLYAGLAALAMVFVIMFGRLSDIGGFMIALIGAAGLLLRWPAAPAFVLMLLFWFLIFPFGIPDPDTVSQEFDAGHFRLEDVLLVASVLVYLACHYRVYGLTTQAVPHEQRFPGKRSERVRRPTDLIRQGELPRLLYFVVGVVIAGQLVWLFVSRIEIDVLADFPLRRAAWRRFSPARADEIPPGLTRLILTTGLLFFGTLLARLVFGYWRLRRMSPAEGGMVLQDAGWDETRRERTRVETWRKWQAERAKKPGRPGEGGKR
jgi:hypothetical protein